PAPAGETEPRAALDLEPELAGPLRLVARDHALRILGEHAPVRVEGGIVSIVLVVVVAHEDPARTLRVGGDAVIGPAEGLPLRLLRGQAEARGSQRGAGIDEQARLAAF